MTLDKISSVRKTFLSTKRQMHNAFALAGPCGSRPAHLCSCTRLTLPFSPPATQTSAAVSLVPMFLAVAHTVPGIQNALPFSAQFSLILPVWVGCSPYELVLPCALALTTLLSPSLTISASVPPGTHLPCFLWTSRPSAHCLAQRGCSVPVYGRMEMTKGTRTSMMQKA